MNHIVTSSTPIEILHWIKLTLPTCGYSNKVNYCELHCDKPLVLLIQGFDCKNRKESDFFISKWDLSLNRCIWFQSFSNICNSTSNLSSTKHKHRNEAESYLSELLHDINTLNEKSTTNSNDNSIASLYSSFGDVLRISFTDIFSLRLQGNRSSQVHQKFQNKQYHSDSLVLITCSNSLIFYDSISRLSKVILMSTAVTYAEFIYTNILAIGCVDGLIRIFDCSSWKVIKDLNFHGNGGSIQIIKNLIYTLPTLNESELDKQTMRFLSIGQDGVAFIWEGDIIGNIIINDKPVGKLDIDKYKISVLHSPTGIGLNAIEDYLINVNQHVYVEPESNNLVIVCADRSIRVWSLNSLNNFKRQTQSQQNVLKSKRKSLFLSSSTDLPTESYKLPLVDKIKPVNTNKMSTSSGVNVNTSIINNINQVFSRYTSCHPCLLPCYPTASTYLISSNIASSTSNNSIAVVGIVQAFDVNNMDTGANDRVSDRASVTLTKQSSSSMMSSFTKSSNTTQRLQLIHEISLSALLVQYIESRLISSVSSTELENLKIFSVQSSNLWPSRIFVASSLGLFVITMETPLVGSRIGRHLLWDNMLLTYDEHSINQCSFNISKESIDNEYLDSSQVSSVDISLDVSVGGNNKYLNHCLTSNSSISIYSTSKTKVKSPTNTDESLLSVITSFQHGVSTPVFHVSISGTYFALVWSQNYNYILYKYTSVTDKDVNESNFVELERGICEYFAWLSEDIYVMKTPSLSQHKVLSNNKSKSNLPNKPVITESHLIYKKIYAVSNDSIVKLNINYSNSADIKPTTHHKAGSSNTQIADSNSPAMKWKNITCLFSGYLLCLNYTQLQTVDSVLTGQSQFIDGKSPTYSQFLAVIPANMKRNAANNQTDNHQQSKTEIHEISNVGLDLSRQLDNEIQRANAQLTETADTSTVKQEALTDVSVITSSVNQDMFRYEVISVGPVMKEIKALVWDYTTGHCAVLIDDTISFLSLIKSHKKDSQANSSKVSFNDSVMSSSESVRVSLVCFQSMLLMANIPTTQIHSFVWMQPGLLYVSTTTSMSAILIKMSDNDDILTMERIEVNNHSTKETSASAAALRLHKSRLMNAPGGGDKQLSHVFLTASDGDIVKVYSV